MEMFKVRIRIRVRNDVKGPADISDNDDVFLGHCYVLVFAAGAETFYLIFLSLFALLLLKASVPADVATTSVENPVNEL